MSPSPPSTLPACHRSRCRSRGFTDVGVPRSGAWHRARHRLAHALVHGTLDGPHPTLEILASDVTLTIHQRQTLALVGPADLTVDGHRAPHAVAVDVSPATTVTIHHRGPGPAYVALSDWQPRTILKSAATDSFSHLGGPRGDGSPLSPGDVLMGSVRTQDDRVGCFVRTEEAAPSEIAWWPSIKRKPNCCTRVPGRSMPAHVRGCV